VIIFDDTREIGLRTITFDEVLHGIMTTFPLGTSTAPRRPCALKVVGTLEPSPVEGLKKLKGVPVVVGTYIIRPSGKSKLPKYPPLKIVPTLPNVGAADVAHQLFVG